jgi:GNAT superfamily N-acetyltransferase
VNEKSIILHEYDPKWRGDFARLNYEWIEEHFEVEEMDRKILEEPERYILQSGGHILFAESKEGEIVGTCALIFRGNGVFELAKMGVTRTARGLGIGRFLMKEAIGLAKNVGARIIELETNDELEAAIRLYEKFGFRRMEKSPHGESDFSRSTVFMRLELEDAVSE